MGKYSEELKEKIIRLHLQKDRSQSSLRKEFNIGRGTAYHWIKTRQERGARIWELWPIFLFIVQNKLSR